ncbi:MAG: GntR family transcriptional regulator, partial [Lentisphaeria bacterium]|nr:GntR family transcriptional regulator [Lentisphaeria bacterium]
MNPKPGIRDRKISRVCEYLMNTLLQLPYGGRLPGIRTVMRETGTGQFTVTHALRHLEQQGLIRITPDRGSFRLEPAETFREVRMLHWSTNPLRSSDFVGIIFRELQEHARAANWKITIENAGVRPPGKLAKE